MERVKQNPLVLAAGIFGLLATLVVLFLLISSCGGSGGGYASRLNSADGGEDTEGLPCSNGAQVKAETKEDGDKFTLVGEIQTFDTNTLRVRTPDGDLDVKLATNAELSGQLLPGDWIKVEGSDVYGELVATALKQPCSEAPVGPAPDRVVSNVAGGAADGPSATRAAGPGQTSDQAPPAAPTEGPAPTEVPVGPPPPPPVDPTPPPPPSPTPEPTPEPTAQPTPAPTPTPGSG